VKLLKKGMMKLSGKNIFLPQNIPGDYELLFPNERTNQSVFKGIYYELLGPDRTPVGPEAESFLFFFFF
jgi:hypothetical protein